MRDRNCRKCGAHIPSMIKIGDVYKNIGNRVFCLSCSPWGGHNTKSSLDRGDSPKKKSTAKYVSARRRVLRERAIEHRGGKCWICGYNKTVWALEFHHVNPENKLFNLTCNFTRSMAKVLAESEKCALLCANCHREVEAGISKIPDEALKKYNLGE
jgi:hypothetical protein